MARRRDGSLILAYERRSDPDGRSQLEFSHYASDDALLGGPPAQTFTAPRTLSTWNEGTPSLRDVTDSAVHVGFHHLDTSLSPAADRNARGALRNFPDTNPLDATAPALTHPTDPAAGPESDGDLNSAVKGLEPSAHHIGDRDFLDFQGYRFRLVEAQTREGDWSSWRVYLYDETAAAAGDAAKALTRLNVATHKGSVSFGNPTATVVTDPSGQRALAVTLFLFAEGAKAGEAGALVYYKRY